jgi:hypothetical protein
VNLVILELLARGQMDDDGAGRLIGAQDLRMMRLNAERPYVPGLHVLSFLAR